MGAKARDFDTISDRFDYVGDSDADLPVWESAVRGAFIRRPGGPTIEVPENVTAFDFSDPMVTMSGRPRRS